MANDDTKTITERFREAQNAPDAVAQVSALAAEQTDAITTSKARQGGGVLLQMAEFLSTKPDSNPVTIAEAAATAHESIYYSRSNDHLKTAEAAKLWSDAFDRLDPSEKLGELTRIQTSVAPYSDLGEAYTAKWDALPDSPTKRAALRTEAYYEKAEDLIRNQGVDVETGEVPRLKYTTLTAEQTAQRFVDELHAMGMHPDSHKEPPSGKVTSLAAAREAKAEEAAFQKAMSPQGLEDQLKKLRLSLAQEGLLQMPSSANDGIGLVPSPAGGIAPLSGSETALKGESQPPTSGGPKASATSSVTAGQDAANTDSLKMGHAETVDQGNLAVKLAPQNQPAAIPQLQQGQTSNVGSNAPAANDTHGTARAPAESKAPSGISGGVKATLKGSALIGGGIAVVSGASAAAKALYHGDSVADAATKGGGAFVDGLPVVGAVKAGRGAEAVMQGVSTVLIGAALATAPLSGGTSFVAATAIEETLRRSGKALGLDLDNAMTTNMAKAMAGAIEKTIPMSAMQTNMNFLRVQENMLKDAGLGEKDANGKTAADYLRDPATRDAYITSLKDSLAKATDPAAREQVARMVEAADKFSEMEGRRVAKLAPYMKEVEGTLAATLKVQQLAGKFKDEHSTRDTVIASSSAPHAPTAPTAIAIQSTAAVNPQSRH